MSTPCSQSLRPNRLVVSEYEVPEVLVSRKWGVFIETLCTFNTSTTYSRPRSGATLYRDNRWLTTEREGTRGREAGVSEKN